MKKNLALRHTTGFNEENHVAIVIPDYRRLISTLQIDIEELKKENEELLLELENSLKEKFQVNEIETAPLSDGGMGAPFPLLTIIIIVLALPTATINTIKLIEYINEFIEKKRKIKSLEDGTPLIGMPLYHPKILEKLCIDTLEKNHPNILNNGGKFEVVQTIDTSSKQNFYYYGVVYLIIIKTNLQTENLIHPHWEFRVKCTGEIIDYREILNEQDMRNLFVYVDDERLDRMIRG